MDKELEKILLEFEKERHAIFWTGNGVFSGKERVKRNQDIINKTILKIKSLFKEEQWNLKKSKS